MPSFQTKTCSSFFYVLKILLECFTNGATIFFIMLCFMFFVYICNFILCFINVLIFIVLWIYRTVPTILTNSQPVLSVININQNAENVSNLEYF